MNKSVEVCELEHTPFRIMSKDSINYVVGRADTKEMLCIGSFNKSFVDEFQNGDFLLLQINSDGTAEEIYVPNEQVVHPSDYIGIHHDKAIVGANVGIYWFVPTGFYDWAKKVFKENSY